MYRLADSRGRRQSWIIGPLALIRNLETDLRVHAPGPSADDMAMIALQRDPVHPGPDARR